MLHTEDITVRRLLLSGNFGLEKEMLRITPDGYMAQTRHPFPQDEPYITRDFCENQVEINTPVYRSIEETVDSLRRITERIKQKLAGKELLWPFSNPAYVTNEDDIRIAKFHGDMAEKTTYRRYLAERYGKYMMTLSGIHFNYSFSGELLRRNYEVETGKRIDKDTADIDYSAYETTLYLKLAEKMMAYGWVVTVLTAASPVMDPSFPDAPHDMASVRCSEHGYWNTFLPALSYDSNSSYVDSIQKYLDNGSIATLSELYYPVRLKPRGSNTIEQLRLYGINHIELRTIDLNPLCNAGVEEKDIAFAQLLMIWLSCLPDISLTPELQQKAILNYKNAAHFSLKDTFITTIDGNEIPLGKASLDILNAMSCFYDSIGIDVCEVMDFQKRKLLQPERYRYADIIKKEYTDNFVEKVLKKISGGLY